MTENYKYGFQYKGLTFGWKNKELYRLPSVINNRTYGFRKLDIVAVGNNKGYRVNRSRKTIKQLMEITEIINYTYTVNGKGSKDCPF